MHSIDWLLAAAPIVLMLGFAWYTRRYARSVADFLAGGRCAGRYLLANARGEADSGLANTMSKFEIVLISGFVLNFWEKVSVPVLLLIGITGFVVYRYRETRALTLAQFLEQRYSRGFRLYMGALAFLSGVLNYGIFPAVSARFFMYFLGLPEHVLLLGFDLSVFALIMAAYLSITVTSVLIGGQVTMMVTDCVEGIFSHLVYIIVVVSVFLIVGWGHIVEVMESAPPGQSLIDPFDAEKVQDFNIWFVVMALILNVYTTMALQNRQGYNAAARTPHESRMGHVLGHWRSYARLLMILALGVCVSAYLRHPDFAGQAAGTKAEIAAIHAEKATSPSPHDVGSQAWFADPAVPQIQKQMTAPVALSHLLPIGIKGLFLTIMVMGLLAGDASHMHSWGSIFVQDVVMPLRKRPLSTRAHMWCLRLAVFGVATFAFLFSLVWTQTQYIALWWAVTAGVFTGGAGAAIIGGLYWKKGTTQAAWAAAVTGSSLALAGILLSSRLWLPISGWAEVSFGLDLPPKFWLNGMQTAFFAACAAVAVYVLVSLLTCRQDYDLDRMLHRGKYALPGEASSPGPTSLRDKLRLASLLKFDANFTFWDKLVSGGIFWWAMLLLAVNLVATFWNLAIGRWPVEWWANYWMITAIILPFVIALATLIWFGIGGLIDTRDFFVALRTMQRDAKDDGRVERASLPAAQSATSSADTTPATKHADQPPTTSVAR